VKHAGSWFDAALAWYFVTVWGSGFIATKIGLQYAPPFTFLTLRFLFGLVCLVPILFVMRPSFPETRAELGHVIVAGLLMHAVHLGGSHYTQYLGMSAGITALILSAQPLITRGERAAHAHASRTGDARDQPALPHAHLRRSAGARAVRRDAERAVGRRHRRHLLRRGAGRVAPLFIGTLRVHVVKRSGTPPVQSPLKILATESHGNTRTDDGNDEQRIVCVLPCVSVAVVVPEIASSLAGAPT
jgi:hypothetical protein